MVTIDLLDNRFVELTDEQKRIEGSIKENRAMRNWLADELKRIEHEKENTMACSGKGKGGKKK